MSVPGVVDTMKAVAPDAKLLVLLRDPVERYRSGVGQWQKRKENRGKRLNLWAGRKDAYARSFYAFALRRYVEAFGRDRLLILQFEQCLSDPAGQYRRTLEFLGLHDWLPDEAILGKPVNVSKRRPSPKALDEPADLVESLEDDVRELLAMAPDFDLALWPNFRHLAPWCPGRLTGLSGRAERPGSGRLTLWSGWPDAKRRPAAVGEPPVWSALRPGCYGVIRRTAPAPGVSVLVET